MEAELREFRTNLPCLFFKNIGLRPLFLICWVALTHAKGDENSMDTKKALVLTFCLLFVVSCFAQFGPRGKAELKAGAGSISIDYGQPALKGRDMLSQLTVGGFWRLGNNLPTVLKTPVDLLFGTVKIPAGDYSLLLKRADQEKFELVFNSQVPKWGTMHDTATDIAQIPLKKDVLANSVELLTIELKEAPKGGTFIINWGTTKLTADFAFTK
jgi:hypothetical protein